MKEEDLFLPVKRLFEDLGYKVNAEVKDCDVTAVNDDELIIIELKKNLSTALLAQALERQKTGAIVYIAVPKPKNYSPKTFKKTLYVIKKLELGLIFINFKGSYAEIVWEAQEFKPVRENVKKRRKILSEISQRELDTNTGGVTGKKIATAYTEKCIHIACILKEYGPLSPKKIIELGADEKKCYGILRFCAYGWFERIDKGIYYLSEKGLDISSQYPELTKYYTDLVKG